MRLEFSAPPSWKSLAFSIQAPYNRCRYPQTPSQEEVCDKMSQKLYNFKWLAHKVGQNWTKLRSTVDPENVDVYLPPAPNLFAVRPPRPRICPE